MNSAAHITPQGLRSGDPDALVALCDRRGAAVFAYCERAAGSQAAVAVAAEAFAQFRRAIMPAGALSGKDQADTLLRSATRRCALVHAEDASAGRDGDEGNGGTGECDGQEGAILVYVEDALAPAEREVVAAHVRECGICAAVLRRLQDAEAAFNVKPGTALPVPVAREILTALVRAAPVTAHGGDESAVRDEALRLLIDGASPQPAPAAPPKPTPAPSLAASPEPIPSPPVASPEPSPIPLVASQAPAPPRPVQPAVIATRESGRLARLRDRVPWVGRERYGPSLPAMLLRGAVRFAAVVIAAGVIGILLGLGLSELTADDATPSPAPVVSTSSTPSATTSSTPLGATESPP